MTAKVIDGKAIAADITREVRAETNALERRGLRRPGLAVVMVGDNAASAVYVRNKRRACEQTGIVSVAHDLPATTTTKELLALIDRLNADPAIDGILVQLPLPAHVEIILMLERAGLAIRGMNAVVVGQSNIVGRPMALELLMKAATITVCHSATKDLAGHVGAAEILVAAMGKPRFIPGDWIRPGAVVVDVGINRLDDGRLVGDVAFDEARERAGHITPVPGGVGPMTIAVLMKNTLEASTRRQGAG